MVPLVETVILHLPDRRTGAKRALREPGETRDRYVADSGASWTVEELRALARDVLLEEPED
jgi:hypothetical protein